MRTLHAVPQRRNGDCDPHEAQIDISVILPRTSFALPPYRSLRQQTVPLRQAGRGAKRRRGWIIQTEKWKRKTERCENLGEPRKTQENQGKPIGTRKSWEGLGVFRSHLSIRQRREDDVTGNGRQKLNGLQGSGALTLRKIGGFKFACYKRSNIIQPQRAM